MVEQKQTSNVNVESQQTTNANVEPQHASNINVEPKETSNVERFIVNVKPGQGCDNYKMFVPTSNSGRKTYCCKYCLKRYAKLVRHVATVHKDEPEVKMFQALPVGE